MGERLEQQQRAVQSVSLSVRTGKQSYNSLLDRNEALEEKLKEAQKKISLAEMQKSLLGETC
jgi:outer membrane protein TolC